MKARAMKVRGVVVAVGPSQWHCSVRERWRHVMCVMPRRDGFPGTLAIHVPWPRRTIYVQAWW